MEKLILLAVLIFLPDTGHPWRLPEYYETRFGIEVWSFCYIAPYFPWIESGNHDLMRFETASRGLIYARGVHPPAFGYDMTTPLIIYYTIHNPRKNGTVWLKFRQFDLHPSSVLYIYDGLNASSPGSLWTHKSNVPMYASTGPTLYVVFKTGKIDTNNKHMGYRISVFYPENEEWKLRPSTGVCAPFKNASTGWWTAIRSTNLPKGVPVFCPYTSQLTDQKYVYTLNEKGSDEMTKLVDYPTSVCRFEVLPYKYGIYDQYTTMRRYHFNIYNISASMYGYYLLLEPVFTSSHQVVVVATGKTEEAAQKLAISILHSKCDTDYHFCPYKNCPKTETKASYCTDYWKPCSDTEQVDATCDLLSDSPHNPYDRCWDKAGHCFNTQVDRCDGLPDCDGTPAKDEHVLMGCAPPKPDDKTVDKHCARHIQELNIPDKTVDDGDKVKDDTTYLDAFLSWLYPLLPMLVYSVPLAFAVWILLC